jgi:predicted amidophosphoribosyltransferase
VGLGTRARERNITGRERTVPGGIAGGIAGEILGEVLVVDDVVTTGVTAREAVRVLHAGGATVAAVLTLDYA